MKEIINTINSGKPFLKDDITRIVSISMTWHNLEAYVKDIVFDSKNYYPANYRFGDRIIVFNDDKIIESAYKLYDLLYSTYEIDENNFNHFLNFYYLYIIHHELEHASQKKKYDEGADELFDYIYEMRKRLQIKKSFYDIYHDLFPTERKAINEGNLKAYQIMCHTNLSKRELDILYLVYLIRRTFDYHRTKEQQIISPNRELLKLLGEDPKTFNDLLEKANLSFDERIKYGFDITSSEYKNLCIEKHNVLKKINSKI